MTQTAEKRIRFACQQCEQLLAISAAKIGRKVQCPKCKHANTVPDDAAAALQIADRKRRKEERKRESTDDFSQFEVFDSETEFVYEGDDDGGYYGGKIDRNKVSVPRSMLYAQGALLGVVALLAFAFGWFVGLKTAPRAPVVEDTTPRIVRGKLLFTDGDRREQPDAGSVVIVVPQDAPPAPNEKVDAIGLRPDDPAPDPAAHPGLQRINVMGGAYARTDAEGDFKLQVPRGRYYVLIISGNTQRSSDDELDKAQLAQMGRYFVPATDLIGRNRFQWTEELIGKDRRLNFSFGGS